MPLSLLAFPVLFAALNQAGSVPVLTEQFFLEPHGLDHVSDLSLEGDWLAGAGGSEGFAAGVLYQRQGSTWVDQSFYAPWSDVDRDVFVGSDSENHHSFVYRRANGAWRFEGDLPYAFVRVHGDRLITSSFRNSDPFALNVWKRGAAGWAVEAVLTPDSPQTDRICFPIDIFGNTVAFRARGAAGLPAIHVYARERGTWLEQAELVPSDSDGTGPSYIRDIVLWGRTLVAVYQASSTSGSAAYVFEREDGVWHERARLAPGGRDVLGADLQEDTLVLGVDEAHGEIYVYERSQGLWTERARLVASDGQSIGRALAVDGRTVVASVYESLAPTRIYQFRLPAFPRITTYGCGINPAESLVVLSGAPAIGTSVRLGLDNPLGTQAAGARAYLALASRPDERAPCGTLVPGFGMDGGPGERLLRRGRILEVRRVGTWNGAPLAVDVAIPREPLLIGHALYLQGLLHDRRSSASVRFGLTEAIELEIGRPDPP